MTTRVARAAKTVPKTVRETPTTRAIGHWVDMIVDASKTQYGNDYISECIRFMTGGVLLRSPERILPDMAYSDRYSSLMKILTTLLLFQKAENISSREYLQIIKLSDGQDLIEYTFDNVNKQCPTDESKRIVLDDLVGGVIGKLCGILANDALKEIFNCMTVGKTFNIESPMFMIMKFKTQLYKWFRDLQIDRANNPSADDYLLKIRQYDRYFLSLATVGKAAASMYGMWQDETLSKNTCIFQSIASPEFNFGQFLTDGPVALFYGNIAMMFEINFVISDGTELECYGFIRKMMKKYGIFLSNTRSDFANHPQYHRRRMERTSASSLFAFLTKIHKIDRTLPIEQKYECLKTKLGVDIGNPIVAFTRPF